ncbi:protein FAM166B [Lingula anatina]|uniref:Protein FAM166B n=1 Tax=Lingula anatina TaxID=7574 RepID=A0A1S3IV38_LINAN|nr:protein FAM166B [Lingula anatina]|eukprot:XP_013402065.2 protein FAM166B [Lingula anatina]
MYKFHGVGESIGKVTARLLKDPGVPHSDHSLLRSIHKSDDGEKEKEKKALLHARSERLGRSEKFNEGMIAGYSGHIPRHHLYNWGKSFPETANDAISDFEREQRREKSKKRGSYLLAIDGAKMQYLPRGESDHTLSNEVPSNNGLKLPDVRLNLRLPLEPVQAEADPYVSPRSMEAAEQYNKSPYQMDNSSPRKYFMSGYMGHVPHSQNKVGKCFSFLSHQALNDFTDYMTHWNSVRRAPVKPDREVAGSWPQSPRTTPAVIYPTRTGMIPRYAGHVPGEKFRCGKTWWEMTTDTLERRPDSEKKSRTGPSKKDLEAVVRSYTFA